jgi:pentatricopeptide repeat protein
MRMRAAAAMGNYEVTRSIFVGNFDGPERVKAGKISVGRNAPSMDEFRILMIAFKNAPELRFEDAFEVFDLVESYGMSPDVSMYNIMMRACERESRWRRVIAMYKDLLYVHRLVPNVQTFDIIVDCCRHSMEEPGVIYEELRKLKLPSDYCYKAALANAGNRIPSQVLFEDYA